MMSLVGKIGSDEVPQHELYFSTEFRWIVHHWLIARWHGKTCFPRKPCAFKIIRVENTFFAKGSAYAVKDFLAFHTRIPESTTDVYHFLKIVFVDMA